MQSSLVTASEDGVGNVLKWILLAVAIACFAALGWATKQTYEGSPPFPDRFTTKAGAVVMTADDITAGKSGFQKADLMDYGSLYGMGSYFGEDYTADNLKRIAELAEENIAQARYGKPFATVPAEQQAAVKAEMQASLQGIDLTAGTAVLADAVADAIATRRGQIEQWLTHHDDAKGWTQAYSLNAAEARQTADFLIYSSLTTVARRPGSPASWTQN